MPRIQGVGALWTPTAYCGQVVREQPDRHRAAAWMKGETRDIALDLSIGSMRFISTSFRSATPVKALVTLAMLTLSNFHR